MKFFNQLVLIISLTFVLTPIYAQEIGVDCTHPKNITIPLTTQTQDKIQNEIYYQPKDKYTFWYKISATATCKLSYKLEAISNEDDYEILIYNYKGTNFCNDIVKKKEKGVSNKTKGIIQVNKGDVYYFSVIHINGYGCGHSLFLDTENKNITVKAIQNKCIEEALEAIIEQKKVQKVDQAKPITKLLKPDKYIKGFVVNSNTKKKIDAIITISDFRGNILQQIEANIDSGFVITYTDKDSIVISISKLGYKPLLDTIYLNSNNLRIKLYPIKIGDKLIMHKIYFHPNTYVLRDESKKELQRLTNFMIENNDYSFEIQGHTNGNRMIKKTAKYANLGADWNFKGSAKQLSKLRAEKIKDYLVKQGVRESQLQTIGYGGDRMIIAKPKNMRQAMRNIRVEVIVVQ